MKTDLNPKFTENTKPNLDASNEMLVNDYWLKPSANGIVTNIVSTIIVMLLGSIIGFGAAYFGYIDEPIVICECLYEPATEGSDKVTTDE